MNSAKLQEIKSTYRNLLHFYTPIMKQQKEIKESILFTIAPKIIHYLGVNLTRDVKDLYSRNYKSLLKDIEEDTKDGKIFHAHGSEELT